MIAEVAVASPTRRNVRALRRLPPAAARVRRARTRRSTSPTGAGRAATTTLARAAAAVLRAGAPRHEPRARPPPRAERAPGLHAAARARARLRARRAGRRARPTRSRSPTPSCPASRSAASPATRAALVLGTLDGVPVACLQGRSHVYEGGERERGHDADAGAASGSAPRSSCSPTPPARCGPRSAPGSLMAITDHINMQRRQPARRARTTRRSARASRACATPTTPSCAPACTRPPTSSARRSPRASTSPSAGPSFETPGRDPRLPHARRRRRRDVDRARGDRRPPLRPARRGSLCDHEPRRGDGRRARSRHEQTLREAKRAAERPRAAAGALRGGLGT